MPGRRVVPLFQGHSQRRSLVLAKAAEFRADLVRPIPTSLQGLPKVAFSPGRGLPGEPACDPSGNSRAMRDTFFRAESAASRQFTGGM